MGQKPTPPAPRGALIGRLIFYAVEAFSVHMATVAVRPLPDGVSQRSNWQVVKSGRRKSTHTKKSAAKRKAKQLASAGDSLKIHRQNGQVQDVRTVR